MNRQMVLLLLTFFALTGCGEAPSEPSSSDPSLLERERARLAKLATVEGFQTMEKLPATKLFGFLTGRWAGAHDFPVIYMDPGARTVTVAAGKNAKSWPAAEVEKALAVFRVILIARGYPVDGKARPVRPRISINGEVWLVLDPWAVLPEESEVRTKFTAEQWAFLYSELDCWLGFSYLAGLGGESRDHPLVVALDSPKMARLRVLGRDHARDFSLDALDDAFACYRRYVAERLTD